MPSQRWSPHRNRSSPHQFCRHPITSLPRFFVVQRDVYNITEVLVGSPLTLTDLLQ
jgi:hypothetical protein